jgi:hypothetical protein
VTIPPDNTPDNTNPLPPADGPRHDSPTTPLGTAGRAAWYRRLPGRLGIWVAAAALVAACVIGSCGFIAGALVSRGFGEHGVSRHDRWGDEERGGGFGRGEERDPKNRRGTVTPSPTSSATVTPTPAQPPTPSQPVSPTP